MLSVSSTISLFIIDFLQTDSTKSSYLCSEFSFSVRITAGALPRGLHALNLSRNKISTIEGLRELTRLRVLDLSYNRILRIGHGKTNSGLHLKFLIYRTSFRNNMLMPLSIDI